MVRIVDGCIVSDDEAQKISNRAPSNNSQRTNNRGGVNAQADADPHYHGPTANVFDSFNDRLIANGLPRWNLGSYVVEPIVSIGFLAALLLIGVYGLIFALGLFFISKWSGGNSSNPSNYTPWTPSSNRDNFGGGGRGYRLD